MKIVINQLFHYLLLNIAMGGNLGGDIPGTFEEDKMEIEYVRFYQ